MPEGDTIHRAAERLRVALAGREIERAEAPDLRSPLASRAGEIAGPVLENVEARGKHLVAHFSGDLALHSHLGMNGRWFVAADGRLPYGKPWLRWRRAGPWPRSGRQAPRLVSESRLRNDPGLMQLGPDPLAAGLRRGVGGGGVLSSGAAEEVGDALLDQRIIAGIGNVIRNEACFRARVSPWRRIRSTWSPTRPLGSSRRASGSCAKRSPQAGGRARSTSLPAGAARVAAAR